MSPSSDVLVERTARLPEEVALHARPAGWLVRAAAEHLVLLIPELT